MAIERSNFLLIAGALAAGGLGGWALRERSPDAGRPPAPNAVPPSAPPSVTHPTGPISVMVVEQNVEAPGTPACDDSQGTPEECPSVGPADEGICANVIHKRCQEFKGALKPRVAAQAVACLRALKGNERCDPVRINQCGHASLMSACPDPLPPLKGQLQTTAGTQPATVTLAPDRSVPVTAVAAACESILKSCGRQPLAPTLSDCRQALAGMNDTGRASMVECVTAHCTDRGLYGCEAVPKAESAAAVAASR